MNPRPVRITKEIQFDAGHRVPNHQSKCQHPHGHRYKVVVHCVGRIIEEPGAADEGMLIDFGDLKMFMTGEIHDKLDHGFIVYKDDSALWDLFGQQPEWKVINFPYIPTAENIARWCFDKLKPIIDHHFRENLQLWQVEVHETPTSVAYYPEWEGR